MLHFNTEIHPKVSSHPVLQAGLPQSSANTIITWEKYLFKKQQKRRLLKLPEWRCHKASFLWLQTGIKQIGCLSTARYISFWHHTGHGPIHFPKPTCCVCHKKHQKHQLVWEKLYWTLENKNTVLPQLEILSRTKTGGYKHTLTTSAAHGAKFSEVSRFCQCTDHPKPFHGTGRTQIEPVFVFWKKKKKPHKKFSSEIHINTFAKIFISKSFYLPEPSTKTQTATITKVIAKDKR